MDFEQYQRDAGRTVPNDRHKTTADATLTFALGLAGESGEVCDLLKKHFGHGHELDRAKLKAELGDTLWYIAALCTTFGLSLADVAEANIEKLRRRYPMGFSSERSINREAA